MNEERDPVIEKIRIKKERETKAWVINQTQQTIKVKLFQENRGNPWNSQKRFMNDFVSTFLPKKTQDFPSTFLPTDDIFSSSGSGTDTTGSWEQYRWLYEKRLGVCNNIVEKPAIDAVRNRFRIADFEGKINSAKTKEVMKILNQHHLKFWDKLTRALIIERIYGICPVVKYYGLKDWENGELEKPAPKHKVPIGLQPFPPTVLSPRDIYKTNYLETEPKEWTWTGGKDQHIATIDPSRVMVLRTRPSDTQWFGQPLFENIWIPLILYFEVFVYMLRHFTKWGAVVPYFLVDSNEKLDDVYTAYADLIDEMKMNGILIGRQGDEIGFAPSGTTEDLTPLMEILKEEIAARTRIPVVCIFGRVANAGLGSGGYQLANMEYWNEVSNIQQSIADDVFDFISPFINELDNFRVDWMLAINKTDQQRLIDEGLEIQNALAREQLLQAQVNTAVMAEQATNPQYQENEAIPGNGGNKNLQTVQKESTKPHETYQSESDFVRKMPRLDFVKLLKDQNVNIQETLLKRNQYLKQIKQLQGEK